VVSKDTSNIWNSNYTRNLSKQKNTNCTEPFPHIQARWSHPLVPNITDALVLSSEEVQGTSPPRIFNIEYSISIHHSLTQSLPAAEAVNNPRIHKLIHTCILSSLRGPLFGKSRPVDVYIYIYIYIYIYTSIGVCLCMHIYIYNHFRGSLVINFSIKRGVKMWNIMSCHQWHIGGNGGSLVDASMGEFFLVYWLLLCHEFKKIAISELEVTVCNPSNCFSTSTTLWQQFLDSKQVRINFTYRGCW
jgi:hypothetical protein